MILSNTTLYNSMWLNGSVTDLQRLARLLSNVNYQEIGEDIIRSIINMINEGTELRAYFEQFLFEVSKTLLLRKQQWSRS